MDALRSYEIEEVEQQGHESFRINDLNGCTWAFRKISAYNTKAKEIQELAQKEIERIHEWQEKELKGIDNSIEYFESLLKTYYAEQKVSDSKYKLSTPWGKISSRKQPDKWDFEEVTMIEWLRNNHPELIRVKEEINKAEFKKSFKVDEKTVIDTASGEIIPGVTITAQEPKITVEVD